MKRTAFLAAAILLLLPLSAQAEDAELDRLSDVQPVDIVSAALRGSSDDIDTILRRSDRIFRMKTYKGGQMDARDVAVYYALFCGRPEAARYMLRRGQGKGYGNLGDMPLMEEACKGAPTTESARRAISATQKEWAEGGADGGCARADKPVFGAISAEALDVILENDGALCHARPACGPALRSHLESRRYPKAYLRVWDSRCR